ncbi:MAG TPA: LPS export ABC transporter permease LptG [Patescibacteria group bacterium]|nr:LPS export ABC transporter permease LptG [Patescibacteria group bacterium]
MITSPTLFRYIGRNFLFNVLMISLLLVGIVFVINSIELLRRSSPLPDVSFGLVLRMSLLSVPQYAERVLPFAVLFGSIYTCWRLNKTHELVVIRSSGISAWQFLFPMMAAALGFGLIVTTIINPVSAVLAAKFDQMENEHLKAKHSLVAVLRTGIWLRQPTEDGYALLHAASFEQKEWRLSDVIVFFFDKEDNFRRRIDSPLAYLRDGFWEITSPLANDRNGPSRAKTETLKTELTATKIEESFASPDSISFWSIPEYIRIMEETGFPATRLHIRFHSLLAQPFFFMAMVLLAATFSLRPPRFGGAGALIGLGVAVGFFVFFMDSMLSAFGVSQKIPAYLAAWTPAVVSLLLGATALLHLEDG